MAKRFYWLKLHKDFFKRHEIRIIEGMPNGKDYILFYLKLLLESVTHDGQLRFSDTIPYSEDMLSAITNTNIDVVRSAMKIFIELQMIEVLEDKTIFMAEVEEMIGSETDEHTREQNRIRQQRYRDKHKSLEQKNEKALHNVTVTLNRNAEIRDKSIENRINKDIYVEIVDYLNQKTGSHYRDVEKTRSLIRARTKEGFSLEDFHLVIDEKCRQWSGDEKMKKYLRPETLFGTKFDGYRNEALQNKPRSVQKVVEPVLEEPEMSDEEWLEMMRREP